MGYFEDMQRQEQAALEAAERERAEAAARQQAAQTEQDRIAYENFARFQRVAQFVAGTLAAWGKPIDVKIYDHEPRSRTLMQIVSFEKKPPVSSMVFGGWLLGNWERGITFEGPMSGAGSAELQKVSNFGLTADAQLAKLDTTTITGSEPATLLYLNHYSSMNRVRFSLIDTPHRLTEMPQVEPALARFALNQNISLQGFQSIWTGLFAFAEDVFVNRRTYRAPDFSGLHL